MSIPTPKRSELPFTSHPSPPARGRRLSPRLLLLFPAAASVLALYYASLRQSAVKLSIPSRWTDWASQASAPPGALPHTAACEAYVTFFSPGDAEYFESVRLIVFALTHDPETLDPATDPSYVPPPSAPRMSAASIQALAGPRADRIEVEPAPIEGFRVADEPMHAADVRRDVVVLTYPGIPAEQAQQLQREGATVVPVPHINISSPYDGEGDQAHGHHWRHTLGKLHVFDLAPAYRRALFLDADVWVVRPLHGIWAAPHSWPASGLAATGDAVNGYEHAVPWVNRAPFNSGFFMAVPDRATFEDMHAFDDWDRTWTDQALLNGFFRWEGERPWECLDHKWHANFPSHRDMDAGAHVLHEKMWVDNHDDAMLKEWNRRMGRMQGYWDLHAQA